MQNVNKTFKNSAPAKVIKLYKQAASGNKTAINQLFNMYTKFAINVANKFYYYNAELEDLRQIALTHLYLACQQYDYTKSAFESYAYRRIVAALQRESKKNQSCLNVADHAWKHLLNTRGMSAGEIEEYVVDNNLNAGAKAGIYNYINGSVSLNSSVNGDTNTELIETIQSNKTPNPESACINTWESKELVSAINCLDTNKQNIICSLYGLGGTSQKTCEQIAKEKGISRQAVSQQKAKILNSLKDEIKTNHKDLIRS